MYCTTTMQRNYTGGSQLAGVPAPGLQLAIRQFPAPTSATHSSPLLTLLTTSPLMTLPSNFSRQSLLDFELIFEVKRNMGNSVHSDVYLKLLMKS